MNLSARAYENLPLPELPRSWAEINLEALRQNYRTLCKTLQKRTDPIAVVKADAYGHGMAACAKALAGEGCSRFAVSCLEEGIALRRALGKTAQILILGYTDPAMAARIAEFDLSQTLLSVAYAKELCRAAKRSNLRLRVQYALDTGMNRIGFSAQSERDISRAANKILHFCKEPVFLSEGMFTHFACADSRGDALTDLQAERFLQVRKRLCQKGIRLFCHICNSAGALLYPERHLDGVRLGIVLWGILPVKTNLPLVPVMRLCTRVVHLHRVAAGERVGYGGTFCARRESLIATLPIGYADGWLRAYEGAKVTVETKEGSFRVPLVGRICMDQCMADVTGLHIKVGDRVVLFGKDPGELKKLSELANTIPYEPICLISPRVPRGYVEEKGESR